MMDISVVPIVATLRGSAIFLPTTPMPSGATHFDSRSWYKHRGHDVWLSGKWQTCNWGCSDPLDHIKSLQGTFYMTFPGKRLFYLRDTHGLPLADSLQVVRSKGLVVEWPSYIDAARANGWYDYMIVESVEAAFTDLGIAQLDYAKTVLLLIKQYILNSLHSN